MTPSLDNYTDVTVSLIISTYSLERSAFFRRIHPEFIGKKIICETFLSSGDGGDGWANVYTCAARVHVAIYIYRSAAEKKKKTDSIVSGTINFYGNPSITKLYLRNAQSVSARNGVIERGRDGVTTVCTWSSPPAGGLISSSGQHARATVTRVAVAAAAASAAVREWRGGKGFALCRTRCVTAQRAGRMKRSRRKTLLIRPRRGTAV